MDANSNKGLVKTSVNAIKNKVNTQKNMITAEDTKVALEVQAIVQANPLLNILKMDPLSIETMLMIRETLQKKLDALKGIPVEQEREFVLNELMTTLEHMNILVPDIASYQDSCDEKIKALVKIITTIADILQKGIQETSKSSPQIQVLEGGMNGQQVRQPQGRGRAGSTSASGRGVPYSQIPQMMGMAGNMGVAYQQQMARVYTAQQTAAAQAYAAEQAAAAAEYDARVKSSVNKLLSVGNGLKVVVFFLLGLTCVYLGSTLAGDAVYQKGVNVGQSMYSLANGLQERWEFIASFGDKPPGRAPTAPVVLIDAFERHNRTISETAVALSGPLGRLQADVSAFQSISTKLTSKATSLKNERDTAKSTVLSMDCFRKLDGLLGETEAKLRELKPQLSSSLTVSVMGAYPADIAYRQADAQKTALKALIQLRNDGKFVDFFLSPEIEEVPAVKSLVSQVRPQSILMQLEKFNSLEGAEEGIITTLRSSTSAATSNVSLSALEDKLPVAPGVRNTPLLANKKTTNNNNNNNNNNTVARIGAPNAKVQNTVVTVTPSGPTNVTLASASAVNIEYYKGPLTPDEMKMYNYLSLERMIPFVDSLLTKVAGKIATTQRNLNEHGADLYSAAVNYYFESAAATANSVYSNCKDGETVCSAVPETALVSVKESLKYLITHEAPNEPPPTGELIAIFNQIFTYPEQHPRITLSEKQTKKMFDFYRNNPSFEVRAFFAILIGGLGLMVYENGKRVIQAPANIISILYLITEIPKQWLSNVLAKLSQARTTQELRAASAEASAALAAAQQPRLPPQMPGFPALPGYAPMGGPTGAMVPMGMGAMGPMGMGAMGGPIGMGFMGGPMGMGFMGGPMGMGAMGGPMGMGAMGMGAMGGPMGAIVPAEEQRGRRGSTSGRRAVSRGRRALGPGTGAASGEGNGAASGEGNGAASGALVPRRAQSRVRAQQRLAAASQGNAATGAPIVLGGPPAVNAAAAAAQQQQQEGNAPAAEGGRRRRRAKTSKKHKGLKKRKSTRKH